MSGRLPTRNALCVAALVAALTAIPGCEGVAFLGQAVARKEAEEYKIPDRPTLVVVDDPGHNLGDPTLEGVIASQIGYMLKDNKTVKTVISPQKLTDLRAELDAAYAKTPVDELGRRLGAEQIISVTVQDVKMDTDQTVYRPNMRVRVRVTGADGERMFPAADAGAAGDEATAAKGYFVNSTLFYRPTGNTPRGDYAVAMRRLAERCGRDVSWLFFRHSKRQPGERFEE